MVRDSLETVEQLVFLKVNLPIFSIPDQDLEDACISSWVVLGSWGKMLSPTFKLEVAGPSTINSAYIRPTHSIPIAFTLALPIQNPDSCAARAVLIVVYPDRFTHPHTGYP